jgi:hypothetical protein
MTAKIRMLTNYLKDVRSKFCDTSINIKRLQELLVNLEEQEKHFKSIIKILKKKESEQWQGQKTTRR